MLPYRDFLNKPTKSEADRLVIQLIAALVTHPNNVNKLPEQVYAEQLGIAGIAIGGEENNTETPSSGEGSTNAEPDQIRNEEPPLSPESGSFSSINFTGSIDVRDENLDKPTEKPDDIQYDDRKDRDPVYKQNDEIEKDQREGTIHSEKKDDSRAKDKENFTPHIKDPHSGGIEAITEDREKESEKDPEYKRTEDIKKEEKKLEDADKKKHKK